MTTKQKEKIFREYPDILTLTELSKMLGISTKLASRLIKDGKVEAIRIGREYRIAKIKVIELLICVGSEKNCVLNDTSNPNGWTLSDYYGMLLAAKENTETEVC